MNTKWRYYWLIDCVFEWGFKPNWPTRKIWMTSLEYPFKMTNTFDFIQTFIWNCGIEIDRRRENQLWWQTQWLINIQRSFQRPLFRRINILKNIINSILEFSDNSRKTIDEQMPNYQTIPMELFKNSNTFISIEYSRARLELQWK